MSFLQLDPAAGVPIYRQIVEGIEGALARGELSPGDKLPAVRELAQEHMTMVVVTHEMAFAREAASHVMFMADGVIVEQGQPEEFFAHPKQERTVAFLQNML